MVALRILQSPRRRRRLAWLAIPLALVPLIYLGVHFSSPGNPGNATGPEINQNFAAEPKRSPFTPAEQQAVRPVLREFIKDAVAGENIAQAWNVAGPSLKQGLSRAEWDSGKLPVVPYPAADRGLGSWSYVEYSYVNSVGLEVFLFPKPGSGYSAMTADVEVVKGSDGRWLVDYWLPKKFHGPPALSAAAKAKAKTQAAKAQAAAKRSRKTVRKTAAPPAPPQAETGTPKPSSLWWAVPIVLLALIVLAPIGLGVGIWYRNRRAARQWARGS